MSGCQKRRHPVMDYVEDQHRRHHHPTQYEIHFPRHHDDDHNDDIDIDDQYHDDHDQHSYMKTSPLRQQHHPNHHHHNHRNHHHPHYIHQHHNLLALFVLLLTTWPIISCFLDTVQAIPRPGKDGGGGGGGGGELLGLRGGLLKGVPKGSAVHTLPASSSFPKGSASSNAPITYTANSRHIGGGGGGGGQSMGMGTAGSGPLSSSHAGGSAVALEDLVGDEILAALLAHDENLKDPARLLDLLNEFYQKELKPRLLSMGHRHGGGSAGMGISDMGSMSGLVGGGGGGGGTFHGRERPSATTTTTTTSYKMTKRAEGPRLSVIAPIDILRQKFFLALARQHQQDQQQQIARNAEFFHRIGRRSVKDEDLKDLQFQDPAVKKGEATSSSSGPGVTLYAPISFRTQTWEPINVDDLPEAYPKLGRLADLASATTAAAGQSEGTNPVFTSDDVEGLNSGGDERLSPYLSFLISLNKREPDSGRGASWTMDRHRPADGYRAMRKRQNELESEK